MKKSVYISGIVCANLVLAGCIAKIQHWPLAGVLLILSVMLFCFYFLPVALVSSYKVQETKQRKSLYITTFIVFFIDMLGVLFKVQHWPGAGVLLLIGIPLPFLVFLPVYLYHTRHEKRFSRNFLAVILGLIFLAVFSVLLSLNVSKNILNMASMAMEESNSSLSFNSSHIISAQNDVKEKAEELILYIENIKNELSEADHGLKSEAKQLSSSQIEQKDNTDIPEQIFFTKIEPLRMKVMGYKESLLHSNISSSLKELVKDLFKNEGDIQSWKQQEFPSHDLIFVMNRLTEIENNIRFTESESVSGS